MQFNGFRSSKVNCLVQNLRIISEAVISLHLVVVNPCTLLPEIPAAAWFTVLDLKDTFFCVPLDSQSQYLFASEEPESESQLTWTVFSRIWKTVQKNCS